MNIVILTGAGVSVPSGLPTYRGPNGLYQDDIVEDGKTITEILDIQTFHTNPALTQKYIKLIRDSFAAAEPNELHNLCTKMEAAGAKIFTQNIDDLHERAGSTPYKIHGTAENPVLFGMSIPIDVLSTWYEACMNANIIIIIGTSCQFPYLIDALQSATFSQPPAKIILLDPDPNHTLHTSSTHHQTDPEAFSVVLQTLLEDLISTQDNDSNST